MHRIEQLIHEAHRRSLWQVLGVYGLGSWAAYQIIAELTDRIGLPEWVPGFAIVLFLIGLPIVLATAFVQEGLPGRAPLTGSPSDPTLMPELQTNELQVERRTFVESFNTPARPHPFFTWHRAVAAGITAFLLLGITAASYTGLRNVKGMPWAPLVVSGKLEQRDRIIIAQLRHTAGDTILAATLTEALRVDLAQSPVVRVLEARYIGDALQRMGRGRDERLDAELAREVAIREGVKAILQGEISPAGGGHIIVARLLHASTGEELVTHRETAPTEADILPAIDRMSRKLREKIGDNLRAIRAERPLEAVTTSSLRALQTYTAAVHALEVESNPDRAIQLLEETLAADSTFAMAWRKLAVAYFNTRAGRSRLIAAATRAYELRDRLTDRERYHAIAFYHLNVTGDEAAAVQAYRSLLDTHPDDAAALNNLALAYGRLRDNEKAAEYYERAIAADSFGTSRYTNLALTQYALGQKDRALSTLDALRVRHAQVPDVVLWDAFFAHVEGRYDDAERSMRALADASRESSAWLARAHLHLAHQHVVRGRLAAMRRDMEAAAAANVARGVPGARLIAERLRVGLEQYHLQTHDEATQRMERLLASEEWRAVPAASRPYLGVAQILARAGRVERARQVLREWEQLPADERGNLEVPHALAEASIALAEDRPLDAVSTLQVAKTQDECMACGDASIAEAFLAASMPDSAIRYYRSFIDTPELSRILSDAWDLAISYERLAELYEARGDRDNAARYAALFVDLWQDADAELQPRVRLKQQLLARLRQR